MSEHSNTKRDGYIPISNYIDLSRIYPFLLLSLNHIFCTDATMYRNSNVLFVCMRKISKNYPQNSRLKKFSSYLLSISEILAIKPSQCVTGSEPGGRGGDFSYSLKNY